MGLADVGLGDVVKEDMIKITPLTDVHPDSGYDEPEERAQLLAASGIWHFDAAYILKEVLNLPPVMVPQMHETIELIAKGLALLADRDFNPRKYSHDTPRLINDYRALVPVFGVIAEDIHIMELIKELEQGYLAVRYGEAHISFDRETWDSFCVAVKMLDDAYHDVTGLHLPKLSKGGVRSGEELE